MTEISFSEATTNTNAQPKPTLKIIRRPNLTTWTWQQVIADYFPVGWEDFFARTKDIRETIADILTKKALAIYGDMLPSKENLYKAFDLTPFPRIRVVIIGQDPYPQPGKAQGLAFSLSLSDPSIPGSLLNIFKELKREYPDYQIPTHGNLSYWAQQGVFLLNMALTTVPGKTEVHLGVWKPFLVKIIKEIVEKSPETIFVLWGNKAKEVSPLLGRCPVLISGHPSPLNRSGTFIGNGHFKAINKILEDQGELPIDWQL